MGEDGGLPLRWPEFSASAPILQRRREEDMEDVEDVKETGTINTGGWCAPSYESFLQFPEVSIQRQGVMYPMPQLETLIITERAERWWVAGRYFVYLRQYGQEKLAKVGPIPTFSQAKLAEQVLRSWYVDVYNVVIRTYKATERNKK